MPLSKTANEERCSALFVNGLVLLMVAGIASCGGGDIPLPEPARPQLHRESDGWIKPGRNVLLKAVVGHGQSPRTFRVFNSEAFPLTLLDDIWLWVDAPNVQVRQGGPYIADGSHGNAGVYLRCPSPPTIPAGGVLEISFDACSITTYESGPGARVIGYHIAAREGYVNSHTDGGPTIVRNAK